MSILYLSCVHVHAGESVSCSFIKQNKLCLNQCGTEYIGNFVFVYINGTFNNYGFMITTRKEYIMDMKCHIAFGHQANQVDLQIYFTVITSWHHKHTTHILKSIILQTFCIKYTVPLNFINDINDRWF